MRLRALRRPLTLTASRRMGRIKWAGGCLIVGVLMVRSLSDIPSTRGGQHTTLATAAVVTPATSAVVPQNVRSYSDSTLDLAALVSGELLFWSLHDCAMEVALQFFGPVEEFLRGAVLADDPEQQQSSMEATVVDEDEENQDWNRTPLAATTMQYKIVSLDEHGRLDHSQSSPPPGADQRVIFTRKRAPAVVEKDRFFRFPVDKEEGSSPNPPSCTILLNGSCAVSSSSSSPSSSSGPLEVRGGGPGGWRGGSDKYLFSLYQKGDGSATDPDSLPKRYVEMHAGSKNARELSKASLQATLEWRKEHSIDAILKNPHPKFDICKQVFPHYFLGRGSSDGRPIFLQRPALLNMKLAEKNKLTKEELLMHYVYVNEYLWQIVEGSSPLQMMTSVIDLSGMDLGMLRQRENIAFLKLFVSTMDSHYPQRAHKTLLLNAPKWFSTLYKLLSPFMRETTKSKIEIHQRGKKQDEAIKKYLGKQAVDLLPPSFFSNTAAGGNIDKNSSQTKTVKRGFWRRKRIHAEPPEEDSGDDEAVEEEEGNGKSPKRKRLSREEERERLRNEAPPVVSELEDGLREFTLQRLKDAGKKMEPVRS